MFTESDDALSELERRMMKLAKYELDRYEDSDDPTRPLPLALVTLLAKAHAAVLARLGKRTGMDVASMMKNPEAFMAQLDRMKMMCLKVIEQREAAKQRGASLTVVR